MQNELLGNIVLAEQGSPKFTVSVDGKATGEKAKVGDKVKVNYEATFLDGTKFDSTYDRGQPFTFIIGNSQVIKCWDLAIPQMMVG